MKVDALQLAILFHDTYERLAPSYGYETRRFDADSQNGRLMIATCAAILERLEMTKGELREKHGTPEEFERAVWEAHSQLFVTTDEAVKAIGKYREEYAAAEE
jgi:hypothetical protein